MSDASDEDRSIRQLEREAERNRAELMSTVGELRERVSPSQVKEDVKHYATRTSQHFVVNAVERARENPLQAAALAALVGYPVWHLIRSIPVPVMLLGAGAMLASRLTGDSGQSSGSSGWQAGQSGYGYGSEHGYRSGYAGSGYGYESGRSGYASDYRQSGYGYEGQGGYGYGSTAGASYEGELQSYAMQSDGVQGIIERNPMLVTGLGLLVGALLGGSLAASGALQRSRQDSY
jgi:hypothetical protein